MLEFSTELFISPAVKLFSDLYLSKFLNLKQNRSFHVLFKNLARSENNFLLSK